MTKPSDALHQHREAVRRIVADHRGSNPRVFGSVSRGTDTAASDLDLLIDPMPDTTLLDIGAMRQALRRELGVAVDVLTPGGLPESFRAGVVASAVPV
jgi:hypothetical protein